MSFIYIAAPYSDPSPKVRQQRYLQTCYYFVSLLARHHHPYSPVVANHHIAQEFDIDFEAKSWMAYNFAMLSSAKALHVLMLPGWEQSIGVSAELAFWRGAREGAPLTFVDFDWAKIRRDTRQIRGPNAARMQ